MNLIDIEKNIKNIINIINEDKQMFIFELLRCYGIPKASITKLQKGNLNIHSYLVDQDYIIEVSDTGRGISLIDQGRVFERFFRCDAGRDKETGGTGLGLAIVKHIVQYYKGTIHLESELGKGTTFKVVLPIIKDSL